MEAGGGAVGIRGGAPAEAAGAAAGAIRAVARVHLVLGLAAAAFAVCVATLHPQVKQQGEGGDCAATAEDAAGMRTDGLLLLLSAGAQSAAATVAAFAPDAWRLGVAWSFAVLAHVVSIRTGFHLFVAFTTAAGVAVGSCPGHLNGHAADLIADSVLLLILRSPSFSFSASAHSSSTARGSPLISPMIHA